MVSPEEFSLPIILIPGLVFELRADTFQKKCKNAKFGRSTPPGYKNCVVRDLPLPDSSPATPLFKIFGRGASTPKEY